MTKYNTDLNFLCKIGLTIGIELTKQRKSKNSDSRLGVFEKYKTLTIVDENKNAAIGLSAIIFFDVAWEFSDSTEELELDIFFILHNQKAKNAKMTSKVNTKFSGLNKYV